MESKLLQPIKAQLELQTKLFLMVLIDISELEANRKPGKNINSIKWISGHIVNTRMTLLSILSGQNNYKEFEAFFGKGTSKSVGLTYPPITKIIERWQRVTEELMIKIENTSDEQLLSEPPFQTSISDTTFLGLIAFFALHEAQHMGQLSIIRKMNEEEITLYDRVICN